MASSGSSSAIHVSSLEGFYELLAQTAPRLLVVDFFAEWCGPCKRVAPQFAELAVKHQRVARFAKVDVDAAPDLAQNAGVRAMPTFHIYKAGERVFELKGADIRQLEAAVLQWSADVGSALEAAEAPPLPQLALLQFDEGRLEKILPRLLQFDQELRAQGDAHALTETEASALGSAAAAMQAGGWPPPQVFLFGRLLRWPAHRLFPVLDALRLAVLAPDVAAQLAAEASREDSVAALVGAHALRPAVAAVAAVAADTGASDASDATEGPDGTSAGSQRSSQEVNQMLGLRFWCNLLAHAPAAQQAALVPLALEAAAQADCHECRRPATRLALSTLLLDLAVLLQRQRAGPDAKTPLVCALQQLLTTPQPDAEVRSRGLLALGTALQADPATALLCTDLDLTSVVAQFKDAPGASSRARALAAKVLRLLESEAQAANEVAADAALYS